MKVRTIISKIFIIIFLIILVWLVQVLFLNQAAKWGMNGWDDWGLLFYYDAHKGNDLGNFFMIQNDIPTPYILSEVYYIGPLKQIFGLNQVAFKSVELLFKSLAALVSAFLVFKITKDKLFAILVVFFSIIFPSTAGVLSHIILSAGYLTIVFMCLSVLYYIESIKKSKKILLAALFFFLALAVCPPRAYLILPVPFIIELLRLIRSFRVNGTLKSLWRFLNRILIFYFLPVTLLYLYFLPTQFLQNKPVYFEPQKEIFSRFKQITSGNLYTLTLPFQMISTLFIDQTILKDILKLGKFLPFKNTILNNFIILNLVLFSISTFLGFIVKGKKVMWSFAGKITLATILLEIVFYQLGLLSMHKGIISFLNFEGREYLQESLEFTIFQASLGGYYLIFGIALGLEWWEYRRNNKLLMLTLAGWLWAFVSEIELYLTNSWSNMLRESNDRYVLVCSIGGIIFISGIFALSFRSLRKIKSLKFRLISIFGLIIIISLITWKNYKLLDQFYYNWNEGEGGSIYWQNTMYQRFLDKFGRENFKKTAFLFLERTGISSGFIKGDMGSFGYPISFRIFYDEKGTLIRDNCKAITVSDFKSLEFDYATYNGEKGFFKESTCVNPDISITEKKIFYPLNNFYAYRMENKQFIDIKDEIINRLDQLSK